MFGKIGTKILTSSGKQFLNVARNWSSGNRHRPDSEAVKSQKLRAVWKGGGSEERRCIHSTTQVILVDNVIKWESGWPWLCYVAAGLQGQAQATGGRPDPDNNAISRWSNEQPQGGGHPEFLWPPPIFWSCRPPPSKIKRSQAKSYSIWTPIIPYIM